MERGNNRRTEETKRKIKQRNKETNNSRGKKVSVALTGKPKAESHKKAISEALKKLNRKNKTRRKYILKPKFVWEISTPNGRIEKVLNLTKFCKEKRINSHAIYKGTSGYRVLKKEKAILGKNY